MDDVTRKDKLGRRMTPRASHKASRDNALAAARHLVENGGNTVEAAANFNSSRQAVGLALLVVKFATPEEMEALNADKMGLEELAGIIRERVPRQERGRKATTHSTETKQVRQLESRVWADLKTALEALSGLPKPSDVSILVRRNGTRTDKTNKLLMPALEWITEFSNDWTAAR